MPVLDYGLQSHPHGSPFVILPYCEGGSIRNLLRERSFYPFPAVRELLEQAAAGIDAAHTTGFVHGDVKPENILLSGTRSHAYLSDLGMSNIFAIQERFTTRIPGDPGGTTAYLSPEQISQGQQTALSDIYSFAMLSYELLTGHLPFDQTLPAFRQMRAKVDGELLDPRRFSPHISEQMKSVLFHGLSRDPVERPRSARGFCQLLADGGGGRGA
ncbi:MAG: serine/threonine-protein kinase [Bryobacterales bacterium]|nr:serine/threonine-protein kinase [Bryobacterales bacterium]